MMRIWRLSVCLSDVCLTSIAYIGPKSRTERARKNKIGTEVAHVTRDSDTIFKVKRSKVKKGILWRPPAQLVTTTAATYSSRWWWWWTLRLFLDLSCSVILYSVFVFSFCYPRRRRSKASWILRSLCRNVCVWVCMLARLNENPWSEWLETLTHRQSFEAYWFLVQKVKGQRHKAR